MPAAERDDADDMRERHYAIDDDAARASDDAATPMLMRELRHLRFFLMPRAMLMLPPICHATCFRCFTLSPIRDIRHMMPPPPRCCLLPCRHDIFVGTPCHA